MTDVDTVAKELFIFYDELGRCPYTADANKIYREACETVRNHSAELAEKLRQMGQIEDSWLEIRRLDLIRMLKEYQEGSE